MNIMRQYADIIIIILCCFNVLLIIQNIVLQINLKKLVGAIKKLEEYTAGLVKGHKAPTDSEKKS